jgi:Predicted DNA modification methylase
MYTTKGETILDPMIGSGTTCIEARLLGRNCIAVDINYEALMLTMHRIYWLEEAIKKHVESKLEPYSIGDVSIEEVLQTSVRVYHGDARRLEFLSDNSVDAVFTHPPYWNIIEYQGICHPGDLSCTKKLEEYLDLMRDIAREIYRVLKPGKYAAILVGDTRVRKHYVPISHHVLRVFLEAGFVLKEEVIKVQHKMKTTREIWRRIKNRDFLLIAHEKLFILRKPLGDEELSEYKYSTSLLYRV